jgi:DNA-binding response OmpR family regulator
VTARILLIEDDPDIAELVAMYLRQDGIETVTAGTGEAGLEAFATGPWDLLVLDINLPGMDGFEVLSEIRRESEVPVVILSARRDDVDVVYGLGIGADDFVTKPFSPKVLVARIRARIRRSRAAASGGPRGEGSGAGVEPGAAGGPRASGGTKGSGSGAGSGGGGPLGDRGLPGGDRPIYRFGPFLLDPENFSLRKEGERLPLAPKEFELLCYLIDQGGRPSTPEEIYSQVWGNEYGEVATVAVHVQRLRKKLEEDPSSPRYIRTAHGYGYAFNTEELQ